MNLYKVLVKFNIVLLILNVQLLIITLSIKVFKKIVFRYLFLKKPRSLIMCYLFQGDSIDIHLFCTLLMSVTLAKSYQKSYT